MPGQGQPPPNVVVIASDEAELRSIRELLSKAGVRTRGFDSVREAIVLRDLGTNVVVIGSGVTSEGAEILQRVLSKRGMALELIRAGVLGHDGRPEDASVQRLLDRVERAMGRPRTPS